MSSLDRLNILEQLDSHIEDSDQYIVIHSALHRLPIESANLKWTILRYFVELAHSGYTLLVPSFTFSFTSSGTYDLVKSPSEVGILGDWIRELCSARRTDHPIYSFVCLGDNSNRLLDCDVSTCFGERSIFSYLANEATKLIMLGPDWSSCTQFHYLEEKHEVPYRYHKKFSGVIYKGDTTREIDTDMYVRNLNLNVKNDFSKQISEMEHKSEHQCNAENRLVQSIQIGNFMEIGNRLLTEDKYNFAKNKAEMMYSVRCLDAKIDSLPVKVLLYGSQNLDLLAQILSKKFIEHEKEVRFEVDICEYGRHKELLYGKPSRFRYDIVIAVEKLQDLAGSLSESIGEEIILEVVELYVDDIKRIVASLGKLVFVNEFTKTDLSHTASSVVTNQSEKTSCD